MLVAVAVQDDLTIHPNVESIPDVDPGVSILIWLVAAYAAVIGAKLLTTRRGDARWLGVGLALAAVSWAFIQFGWEFALRVLVGGGESESPLSTLEVPILRTAMEFGLLMAAVSAVLVTISEIRVTLLGSDLIRIQKALMRFGLWVLGLFTLYEVHFASGYSIKAVVLGIGGAMVFVLGLGLQRTLGNLFAGFDVQADSLFEKGDMVQVGIGGPEGTVWDTSLRSTRVLTIDGEMLTIANGELLSRELLNLDQPSRALRVRRIVGISYAVPPMKAKDVMLQVLRQDAQVLPKPAPNVLVHGYGDSSINYELRFWVADRRMRDEDVDGVLTRIWYALHDNRIEIAFPTRTLRMVDLAAEAKAVAQDEARVTAMAAQFALCPLFDSQRVSAAERQELARDAIEVNLQPGEAAVRQGDVSDHMYLIVEGSVRVMLKDKEPVELAAPHWFGEMALLLGQPRSADVIAGERGAKLLQLGGLSVQPILNRRPEFAREIRNTSEVRRVASGLDRPVREQASLGRRLGRLLGDCVKAARPW